MIEFINNSETFICAMSPMKPGRTEQYSGQTNGILKAQIRSVPSLAIKPRQIDTAI